MIQRAQKEDYIRRWPHGAMVPYFDQLDSGPAATATAAVADAPVAAPSVPHSALRTADAAR